jgi:hypothetical protein
MLTKRLFNSTASGDVVSLYASSHVIFLITTSIRKITREGAEVVVVRFCDGDEVIPLCGGVEVVPLCGGVEVVRFCDGDEVVPLCGGVEVVPLCGGVEVFGIAVVELACEESVAFEGADVVDMDTSNKQ